MTRCCKNCFQNGTIKQMTFRKKSANAVTKSNNDKIVKQEPAEEIIIPPEKKDKMLNKLRKAL